MPRGVSLITLATVRRRPAAGCRVRAVPPTLGGGDRARLGWDGAGVCGARRTRRQNEREACEKREARRAAYHTWTWLRPPSFARYRARSAALTTWSDLEWRSVFSATPMLIVTGTRWPGPFSVS